jgi:hypothetical protein
LSIQKNTAIFASLREFIVDMTFSQESFEVFERAILDYHKTDNIDAPIVNPYQEKSIEFYLYGRHMEPTDKKQLHAVRFIDDYFYE